VIEDLKKEIMNEFNESATVDKRETENNINEMDKAVIMEDMTFDT